MKPIHLNTESLQRLIEFGRQMGTENVSLDLLPRKPEKPASDYSVPEAAKRLRVRRETVLAWIKSGELAGFNIGKRKARYRITLAALDDFQRRRAPAKPVVRQRRQRPLPDVEEFFT